MTCSLIGRHSPAPLTTEAHHVIPVAWQLFWQPATAPFPGKDPDGRGMLWDSRTVDLCPTHHRNVHALIVVMMRQVAAASEDAVPVAPFPGLTGRTVRSHGRELEIARTGLQRVLDVGGSLLALTGAGEWGEA